MNPTERQQEIAKAIEVMVEPIGRTLRVMEERGLIPDVNGGDAIAAGMEAIAEMFPSAMIDEDELAGMIAKAMDLDAGCNSALAGGE